MRRDTIRGWRALTGLLGAAVVAAVLGGCAGDGAGDPGPAAPVADGGAALLDEAQGLRTAGNNDEALARFEQAIAVNPELTAAYLGAADIYRSRGNYTAAEPRYAKAAELEPRNFDAQFGHGLVLQLLNRFGESVRAYLRALAIRPNDLVTNRNLAMAYLQLGEPRQALAYAQRAVHLDGRDAASRVNLGSVYAELGENEAAVIEFQQAAELMELTPELLLKMADSLGRLQRWAEMASTLEQAIRVAASPAAHERLGYARFKQAQYAAAIEQYRAALRLDADYYPALNGVGVCRLKDYLDSGRADRGAWEEAVRALRRSLQVNRDQPRVAELLTLHG